MTRFSPAARRKIVLGLIHIGFPQKSIQAQLGYGHSAITRDVQVLRRTHRARNIRQLLINTWAL